MKSALRALLSLCLCLAVALGGPLAALGTALETNALDYSIAEKLLRQIEAGSGFEGTLTLEMTPTSGREAEAITTKEPLTFSLSYIYVREEAAAGTPAEGRYELIYPAGDTEQLTASLATREGAMYLKTSLLGGDWYNMGTLNLGEGGTVSLPVGSVPPPSVAPSGDVPPASDVPSASPTPEEDSDDPASTALLTDANDLLSRSAMPSLLSFFLPLALEGLTSVAGEEDPLAPYTTKIDLWIEGYRQDAVLGKLKDGTSTMEVNYSIPPAAIKSQLKQLVLDLLGDPVMLAQLQALLQEEQIAMMLNPALQSYYFFAIDELPLEEDLTISRTVTLKGNTLALHMRLPLYDQEGGPITIAYDRDSGEGDLPDENVISLESQRVSLRLEYQEYSTMTNVTVYQGRLERLPKANPEEAESTQAAAGEEEAHIMDKALSVGFSLTHEQTTSTDEEERELLGHNLQLSVEPLMHTTDEEGKEIPFTDAEKERFFTFPAFDIALEAVFASKAAKNAATSLDFTLRLTGEELAQSLDVTFSGKTKAKWTPAAIPVSSAIAFTALSQAEQLQLLAGAGAGALLLLGPSFVLPGGEEVPEEGTAGTPEPSGETPEDAPATTPEQQPETTPHATPLG